MDDKQKLILEIPEEMAHDVMEIIRQDGTKTIVDDPFGPMKATYAALREDPAAMPELSDASRALILEELKQMEIAVSIASITKPREVEEHKARGRLPYRPNRHDRRAAAAKARKAAKKAGVR